MFKDNFFDFVYFCWFVGIIFDWVEFFCQVYCVFKFGGFIEMFECNGFYEFDDGILIDDMVFSKWGYFFCEGVLVLGLKVLFSVVKDRL